MFWKHKETSKLIPVLPKNYRRICLRAIELASDPRVLMDKKPVTDFSEQGKLTQEGIRSCINFEVLDGKVGIVGFHGYPNEMWVNENHKDFASYCEQQGWLRIEGPAS